MSVPASWIKLDISGQDWWVNGISSDAVLITIGLKELKERNNNHEPRKNVRGIGSKLESQCPAILLIRFRITVSEHKSLKNLFLLYPYFHSQNLTNH